ncbi:MAG: sulfotransferase [Marinicaulis sp.]|nr:sulfotransferase [Marinicaulis sp.]
MASLEQISELVTRRELAPASTALRKLVRQKSKPGIDWQVAMGLAWQLGDQEIVLAAAQNWRAQNPSDPPRLVAEIISLGSIAKHKEAALLARQLQRSSQSAADGYYLVGFYQARFGKRDKALELCRKALAIQPEHGTAWEQIALLNGYEDRDADIAAMLALETRLNTKEQLIAPYYALGRAFDHADDTDKAFAYISKGAALRTGAAPFQIPPLLGYLDRLRKSFNPAFVKQHENGDAGAGLVFILSTPRAGSTLIEQIISTVPVVTPTSEHTILRNASLVLDSMEPQDMARATTYTPSDWRKIAQGYFDGLRRRFGASKSYTDKTLINYYYAGLIRILFPAAKVIWLRRDPRDVVWSCYRSRINANQWAESIETACSFIKSHNNMCAYWAELFGDQLLTLDYEQLVSTPDKTSQKIFNHIGMERPDEWGDFYKSSNPVATASLAQVREPLNTKGVGSWRRYEKFLTPIYDKHFT